MGDVLLLQRDRYFRGGFSLDSLSAVWIGLLAGNLETASNVYPGGFKSYSIDKTTGVPFDGS